MGVSGKRVFLKSFTQICDGHLSRTIIVYRKGIGKDCVFIGYT